MDIKNISQNVLDPYRSRIENDPQAQSQRSRQAESTPQPQGGDRISVSPEARLMTEAYRTAMNTTDIRQDKVDAIKERIASGSYSVDAKNIAEKMLQSDADIISSIKE